MVQNNEHMFKKLNLSPLAIKVLAYLSRSPNKQYYVREIARLNQNSLGGCHKVLKELFNMELVDMEKSGRNQYYKIRIGNPAIAHFKIFINVQELNDILKDIKNMSKKIILFGSCAMGEDTLDSDIDILVITEDVEEIKKILKGASVGGRKLKPIILSPHGFVNLKNNDIAFYAEVNKGMVLWRD
ncbi:MAG: hypothetical protein CVT88_02290 [Candidatus Altiarchaeales archaeon HGW-Altiarchaeales-1]|nr:MAG: hypothetical protein CVT88_02290 [Candidatus Altiarchaeales archaeon HGW-Altiarchaeales-1]